MTDHRRLAVAAGKGRRAAQEWQDLPTCPPSDEWCPAACWPSNLLWLLALPAPGMGFRRPAIQDTDGAATTVKTPQASLAWNPLPSTSIIPPPP